MLCPLELEQLELQNPFGRQAVETLMGSVGRAVRLLRTDGPSRVVDEVSGMTANLCDSLVEMMPKDERVMLAAADYQVAMQAHAEQRYLRVRGEPPGA